MVSKTLCLRDKEMEDMEEKEVRVVLVVGEEMGRPLSVWLERRDERCPGGEED